MIQTKDLTMHYGPVVALDNVSFEVHQGEIVGLLGPNGAGKSTTMKILTTYLHPTKGTAIVGGTDVLKDPLKVRQCIGYLPEVLPLYMDMEVRSYLTFVGKARGPKWKSSTEANRRCCRYVWAATDVSQSNSGAFEGLQTTYRSGAGAGA